jgi:mono/diheme cytochrome c family protein
VSSRAFSGILTFLVTGACVLNFEPTAAPSPDQALPPKAAASTYRQQIQPLLQRYCYSCHGKGRKKGDLALDAYKDENAIRRDRRVWEIVLRHVRTGEMPPKHKPQPSLEERELITSWIATEVLQQSLSPPDRQPSS